jgi:hypothetical protein
MGKISRTLYELVKGKKAYLKKKPKGKKKAKGESVYFKNIKRNSTTADRLKAAGIDWEKDKPSARLKRRK